MTFRAVFVTHHLKYAKFDNGYSNGLDIICMTIDRSGIIIVYIQYYMRIWHVIGKKIQGYPFINIIFKNCQILLVFLTNMKK